MVGKCVFFLVDCTGCGSRQTNTFRGQRKHFMQTEIIMSCEFETTKMHYDYLIAAQFRCKFGLDGLIYCMQMTMNTNLCETNSIILRRGRFIKCECVWFRWNSNGSPIYFMCNIMPAIQTVTLHQIPIPNVWQKEIYGWGARQNNESIRSTFVGS